MPKIGVLLYTYNRTEDAFINSEIIRQHWSKNDFLKDVIIVHAFNGQKEWWPEKYLEDELLYLKNNGHFGGAEILIDEGVKTFQNKYPDVDYVVVLASDTWLVKPEYLVKVITTMQKDEKYLATCAWGTIQKTNMWSIGAAIDFNIFDLKWASRADLFPIRFKEFKEKYQDLFFYRDETIYLERVLMARFKQAIMRTIEMPSDNMHKTIAEAHVYRMIEREPVHFDGKENRFFKIDKFSRKMYWPSLGLITHHDPAAKQKVLKEWNLQLGGHTEKFLTATDLSYYNRGLEKHVYLKNGKTIDYGD